MNASSPKIAVLGPRQSGKTCLAIGLSVAYRPDEGNKSGFAVVPAPGNSPTFDEKLKALSGGRAWPEANNKGDVEQIVLTIQKTGEDPVPVPFIDYAGERLQSEEDFKQFANQHLAGLDGALLLVNPSSDAFSADKEKRAASRVEALRVYTRIVERLRDLPTRPFVALTITASDRLDGDLKDRKDDVVDFVRQLSTILDTSGRRARRLRWERFDVSVTGHLESQDTPCLATGEENTSAEPFLWLLERIVWKKRIQERLHRLRIFGIAAFVAATIAGAWCAVDASTAKKKILNLAEDCERHLAQLGEGRDSRKGELDDAIAAIVDLRAYNGFWCSSLAMSKARELDPKVWKAMKARMEYLRLRVEKDDDIAIMNELLRKYTPFTEESSQDKTRLEREWEKDKPRLGENITRRKTLDPIRDILVKKNGVHGDDVWTSLVQKSTPLTDIRLGGASEEFIADCDATKSKLDERIAKEGEWLVREFEQAAFTNASLMATRSFAEKLAGWTPVTTNGATARGKLLASVSNSIPICRTTYEMAGISNRVIRPMLAERDHDAAALSRLYLLYAGFDATDETDADDSLSTFLNDARLELDNRIADDWKSYILPAFGTAAATGATAEAVQKLIRQLEDWKPATTNGMAARTDLLTSVTNAIPLWRGAYEKEEYAKKLRQAILSENLAELAAVSPGRYPANEFLKAETVSNLWKKTGEPAFEAARAAFVSKIVNGAVESARQKCPSLSDRDRARIHEKVLEVGKPLDESLLLVDVTKAIKPHVDTWNEERRAECMKWLEDRKELSPIDLMKGYRSAASGRMREENPFFAEIVSSSMYKTAEKCLSRYVEVFEGEFRPAKGPSIWDDTDNLAVRYKELHRHFQEFRDMCRTIQDIGKPPVSTWAYRFAQLCMDPNHGNLDAGNIAKAFPQRLSIEKVVMSADYHGKLPTYYKYTAFAARICVTNFTPKGEVSSGSTTVLLPFDKDNRSAKDDEGNAMRASDKKNDVRQREIHPATPWLVDIHLGERVVLQPVATDYNKGTGERQSSKFKEFPLPWGGRETLRSAGNVYDLSFKVKPSIGRWESSKDATCSLTIYGHVKGYSMIDLLKLAKEDPAGNK